MNKVKHILAIFIVLSVVALLGYFLPRTGFVDTLSQKFGGDSPTVTDTTTVQDTTPFIEKMKMDLKVVQSKFSKKSKREVWTLGKGRTIIYYLLQAQRFLNKNGGQVLYMEELHDENQSAKLDAFSPQGDSLHLLFQISDNVFRDNASYLTIAFQVTKLSPELIVALNNLDFPYDLLVTPFGMAESFFPDLDRVKDKELVLWLLMESSNLDSRHRKMRPLRTHHTDEQIESIITDAKKLVPSAKGIATRFAEQGVEHKQLLQAVFSPAKENNLWFLDLSANQKSKVPDVCDEMGITCKTFNPYNPSNSALDDYIKRQLRGAARSGIGAMILPLNEESLAKVKTIKEKAAAQGTTIVNLSRFMTF